jgi:predicted O-linked N-acetylglucosamine transferase (SPINDLY family)
MDAYIKKNLDCAKEYLETGIQLNRKHHVQNAINIYSSLHPLTKDNIEYQQDVKENMIRACSCMCILDSSNAISYLDIAVKYDKHHPVILNNYGFVYHKQHQDFEKSIQNYEKCLTVDKTYSMAYLGIIDVYRSLRHHKLELQYCKKGVRNCSDCPELWNSLGLAYLNNHEYRFMNLVFDSFNKALALNPTEATKSKLFVNIGHCKGILGDFRSAVSYYLQAIEYDSSHLPAYQNILLNLHYYSNGDIHDQSFKDVIKKAGLSYPFSKSDSKVSVIISNIHKSFFRMMYPDSSSFPQPSYGKSITDKITIGFVSSDLIDHAVSFFCLAFLKNYNKDSFTVYIYSNNLYNEGKIATLRCDGYRCIVDKSADVCCTYIQNDKVDILIDLSGFTAGNRLDIFAKKPVNIMLSYVGYPDNVGFSSMKRISDKYTEKCTKSDTVLLKRLFLCYNTQNLNTFVKKERKEKLKFVTFGCFAKLQKINEKVIDAFIEILNKVKDSRLILKSRYFADAVTYRIWKEKFKSVVDYDERIILFKGTATPEEHLVAFQKMDIHLDTFPYSGTTITTESLLMDVPVVTLSSGKTGTGHVQRVSGSILHSMGLDKECIAANKNEYVDKAVKLSKSIHVFPSVRDKFLESEICDQKDFTEKFEELLSNLHVENL